MKKNKDNMANMACLDIFLASLSTEEYKSMEPEIQPFTVYAPLLGMDLYS